MNDLLLANEFYPALTAFVLVLIPAIIVHEIGHYCAARFVGIRILEFGIGIPPRITRLFHWKGTDFTLNWLPLGGFVRPLGEDLIRPLDEEANAYNGESQGNTAPGAAGTAVQDANPWARMIFFLGGSVFNLLSAFLLLVLSALFGVMQPTGSSFVVVQAAATLGLEEGDRIIAVNDQPMVDWEQLAISLLASETISLQIERADRSSSEISDIQLADTASEEVEWVAQALILGVEPGSPADLAGIRVGDRVITVDGERLGQAGADAVDSLIAFTAAHRGQEIHIGLRRDAETLEFSLVPRLETGPNQGAMGIVIRTAFELDPWNLTLVEGPQLYERQTATLPEAVQYASSVSSFLLRSIIQLPVEIIRGAIPAEYARPVSIVGISQLGGQQMRMSLAEGNPAGMMEFAAFISIALGITNLLPLPALDGGRIGFVLIELVRGKPIAPRFEGAIHLVGFAFLLALGILIIVNDLANPLTSFMTP
ncbi:MAG: RIP metalloprotease RseP [Anaerolineaceae bacterium]|nr:RIP metalloprotease RseP [Anaerolineaceae bacterium]